MKYITILSFLLCTPVITVTTGCGTTQVQQANTLEAVGVSAKASIDTAVALLKEGKITVEQWNKIAALHKKFLVSYNFALTAVKSDLSQNSPAELVALSLELAKTVATFQK